LKNGKPLPVMVYIFGGAFNAGGAVRELYGPDYFMTRDVVLVTFNYRVNCLGKQLIFAWIYLLLLD